MSALFEYLRIRARRLAALRLSTRRLGLISGYIALAFGLAVGVTPASARVFFDSGSPDQPIQRNEEEPGARTQRSAQSVSGRSRTRRSGSQTAARRPAKAKPTRMASLGGTIESTPKLPSLSGGGVAWSASAGCLDASLRTVIDAVAANYGSVTVNSTCRSRARNRAVGGAGHSYHLTGDAADIRIRGNIAAASSYLRSAVGGFKHYGGGLFHIDTGPRRRF